MATQSERRAATRGVLIEAAREAFVNHGYDETSIEQILELAGVSRGALYHHFSSKRDIFQAVFEQVSNETIGRAIRHTDPGATPLAELIAGCAAWLREVRDPSVAAIVLDQGPRVLGWTRARAIEEHTTLALLDGALRRAVESGDVAVRSTHVTSRLLSALLAEAAMIAVHDTQANDVEHAVRELIEGLQHTIPVTRRRRSTNDDSLS